MTGGAGPASRSAPCADGRGGFDMLTAGRGPLALPVHEARVMTVHAMSSVLRRTGGPLVADRGSSLACDCRTDVARNVCP